MNDLIKAAFIIVILLIIIFIGIKRIQRPTLSKVFVRDHPEYEIIGDSTIKNTKTQIEYYLVQEGPILFLIEKTNLNINRETQ